MGLFGGSSSSYTSVTNKTDVYIPTDNVAGALALGALAKEREVEVQALAKKAELLQEQQFKKAELLQKYKALSEIKQLFKKYAKALIALIIVGFLIKIKQRKKR